MTDREALYRAILAHPDDDTSRLVYADWLQENGREEEAEFIRVECRLDAATPDDPELVSLQNRRSALRLWLSTHAKRPELRFPAGLKVQSGADWWKKTYRGFPRFLEFEGYRRDGLKPIRALARALTKAFATLPTRWLVVRFISIEQLAELFKQSVIAGLNQLTIQLGPSEEPLDEACRLVANCKNLRNLQGLSFDFSFGTTGAEALAVSTVLGGLRWLALEPASLTPASIRSLAASTWFRELRELSFNGNCPGEVLEELCGQKPFPYLHSLNLTDNDIPVSAWQVFAHSKTFPALADLDLSRTDMSGERFRALVASRWFRPHGLDLNACAIGDDGATEFAKMTPWATSLTRIRLCHNGLNSVGSTAIARCPHLSRLKHLDLGYNAIGAKTLRAIATNPALRGLTNLKLHCRPGESRGPTPRHFERFFADLDMPNLQLIDLSGHPIGGKAARMLANDKFGSLTQLGLGSCKLTDAAVDTLLTAPALQELIDLDLSDNGLKTGVLPLTNRHTLPLLTLGCLQLNPISPDLAQKLRRRRGIQL